MSDAQAVFMWTLRYVNRLMDRSDADREEAQAFAQSAAEEQVEAWGDDVAEWESPEDAADEEMSCWDQEPQA